MTFLSRGVSVACMLLGTHSATTAAVARAQTESRRLNVRPEQSIAAEVQNAHAQGNSRPKFTLHAEVAGAETDFEVNVREAVPAVTSQTTTSIGNGESRSVNGRDVATLLIADQPGAFAVIAVEGGGRVNGIIKNGNEKAVQFTQNGEGGKAWVSTAKSFDPPPWACGTVAEETRGAAKEASRSLFENGHDHDHDHSDHDHTHHFDPSNTEDALADLQHSLRGSELRIGKRRRVQGASYAYWVDVYVEIDFALCTRNGETCQTGIGTNTINYVNSIFTGANTIYETEIDTHLNVLHINLNTNYDSATSTSAALTTMRTIFGSTTGWHFTSPSGIQPDIHHALLSKDMGGGIAYIGVICRSDFGFGLSGSLSGAYRSMGEGLVWDMMVFMHEVGHNFGSGHTHETAYYSPVIDTCGTTCPTVLPPKSSTIMSYCHLCSGGYVNMDYTFGGKYKGSGLRSDINSYDNSPLLGTIISIEPRKVNAKMWQHVSSRGTCTNPHTGPTSAPTPCTEMNVEVKVTTDDWPEDTSWSLRNDCTTEEAASGRSYTAAATLHSVTHCVPTAQYSFTIYDSYNDGICCSAGAGSYAVVVNGATNSYLTGGSFRASETKTFGTCALPAPPSTQTPTVAATPTNIPTKTPTAMPSAKPTVSPTAAATQKPTTTPTDVPTKTPTAMPSAKPTVSPTAAATQMPTTTKPSSKPTTRNPTSKPTTNNPTTRKPTRKPTTRKPTTRNQCSLHLHEPVTSDTVTRVPLTSTCASQGACAGFFWKQMYTSPPSLFTHSKTNIHEQVTSGGSCMVLFFTEGIL